ncbi:MAG: TRAP transporter substrate-binding protein [Rhodoplanes sp.]|uniref:TRAP transporter substrate-binding protein n=1 Tax=Rhodoplanes sp. TaxID=1968906 RepID=UPI0017C3E016|nr:TRAP transporter substrate-binding protein [Rhodoplanes sp.]NVO15326.1 TRAP transporter substrate-binding protein [Rhodoplanes sp.]
MASRAHVIPAALLILGGLVSSPALAQTTVKLGHDQPETSTHHQAAVKWKELVESRTGGKVKVQIFPSSMLGSGTQMVEQVQAGALEAAVLPTAWVAPLAPSVQVLDLPFLFPNREVAYKVVDGPVGTEILKPLEKVNIEGVAFWESGFKQFTANTPIRQPADYKGQKIRTMPAPVIQEQFKAFGATPTMINFSELYSALQQKVVDGQENPIATIASMRFFEVQKYMTLSDHGFLAYVFMINKPMLDKLPADQRDILVKAAREAGQYQRDIIKAAEAQHLEAFKKAGVEIMTLSPEQRAEFEKASRPVYDWYIAKFGPATVDLVRADVAKAQGK